MSSKLDKLISLVKIIARKDVKQLMEEVSENQIQSKILEITETETSYTELCERVAKELKAGERTVARRLAQLKEWGLVVTLRRGKEVYYIKSDLV